MPKIRLVEKKVVTPLTEKERSEVVTGLTNNPGGGDVILSGGADAAIRYYQNGQGGSLSLKEVGALLDEFFESIKDNYAVEEIVTVGTPHWSESLEGDIFPVKLRNKPMMYWVMYTDGYGKSVSRSTYSRAAAGGDESNAGVQKGKKRAASRAEKWLKKVLAEFNETPARYEDGYEIEDLIDIIEIDSDELEDYEKELDYVVAGLAKAGFEML